MLKRLNQPTNQPTKHRPLFVSGSHQTGLDTMSMTRRLIVVGITGGEGTT